jgi:GAF domain-containing protein
VNIDRLLREVERRLGQLPEQSRSEALDAIREEIARDRRRLDPADTVEAERERRQMAEILRDVLEAITRQSRLEGTIDEILKQLARVVVFDSCSIALLGGDGRFRIIAVRGFPEPDKIVGLTFRNRLAEATPESPWPLTVADVDEDERFEHLPGGEAVRSWAGIPLVVEGQVIGLLSLDRHRVEPFDTNDLHRAKAVAFSAAVAIHKAQLLENVRRYASLMDRVIEVDQAVFAGRGPAEVARVILEGAAKLGDAPGGVFVLGGKERKVAAAAGPFAPLLGRRASEELTAREGRRLDPQAAAAAGSALGLKLGGLGLYLVPLVNGDSHVGTLALLESGDRGSDDDSLMQSYASRAAAAYAHAVHDSGH